MSLKKKLVKAGLKVEANMSNTTFWKMVGQIGWNKISKKADIDFESEKKRVKKMYPKDELISFREKAVEMREALKRKLSRVKLEVSDDSFWDLTAHIVGLGKKAYDEVMQNPKSAKKLRYGSIEHGRDLGKVGYVENFEYILPYGEESTASLGKKLVKAGLQVKAELPKLSVKSHGPVETNF